ncbi:MAG: tetratricopeptide repeat protein, partial [Nitrospirota bacterium]|nr:tetratricopeptide repeat protein [Nitrospirota bacterium]
LAIFNWVFRATSWLPWVRTGCRSIGLAWILVLCFLTVQRNALYQDPVLLWSDSVHKSPEKARPHNNLGHAYALQGDWNHAIEEFRVALTLQPDYILAQENLREAYLFHVGRDK